MRDRSKTYQRTLNMKKVIRACFNKTFGAKFPEHYVRSLPILAPHSLEADGHFAEMDIEEAVIRFCREYLDASKKPEEIALIYGTTAAEVESVRGQWAYELSKYFE